MELILTNLTKRYGQKVALDGFSYTFREGIYGILGANGVLARHTSPKCRKS